MDDFQIPAHLLKEIRAGRCIAFVGAGFSAAAGLPSWMKLMLGVIQKAKELELFDMYGMPELPDFLVRLVNEGANSPENFDMCAQILEDTFGSEQVSKMMQEMLRLPGKLNDTMQNRLNMLKGIPFKAVLTTNFDELLLGDVPTANPPYKDILRSQSGAQEVHTAYRDCLIEARDVDGEGDDASDESNASSYPWPVIKLHGCIKTPSSMVWSRTGYRRLINEVPGYINFLRSLIATSTVLYIGFSFSDGYLNDIRGEILSMYRNNGTKRGSDETLSDPLGYAIVHDKGKADIEFFRRHEGVQILTWNSYNPDNSRNFEGLDTYLQNIYMLTSSSYYLGKLVCGHRVLVIARGYFDDAVDPSSGEVPRKESISEIKANRRLSKEEKLFNLLQSSLDVYVTTKKSLCPVEPQKPPSLKKLGSSKERVEEGICAPEYRPHTKDVTDVAKNLHQLYSGSREYSNGGAIHMVYDDAQAAIECMRAIRYDLVICVYGWRASGVCLLEQFVTGMRQLPFRNQAPFIVSTTTEGIADKRVLGLKMGSADLVTDVNQLVEATIRLLKKMKNATMKV
jgi:hypothetical protein